MERENVEFFGGLPDRDGVKLTDKLLIGNIDTGKSERCEVQDLPFVPAGQLPTPSALTVQVKGTNTTVYDGSAAKTINIPQMSGSTCYASAFYVN